MAKVTMADVAKEAGVSKSTVSQYLNKRYEYMGHDTKKRIEEAIAKLGYQPNFLARSLKQKRTSTIGIIVANIMHRFSTEVSRSIEDFFHEHDIHAIVCNADDNPKKEKKYIEMLRAKQVDGLIIFPTGKNIALYESMIKENYPVVFMDRKIEELNVDTIAVNNKESTYHAIKHFIEAGHEQIALITPPLTISSRIERVEGYKQALSDHNLTLNPDYLKSVEIPAIQSELDKMFSLSKSPTALLAGNDLVLLEVLAFLKEKGIKVPRDLSLIVFDNLSFAHISEPTITAIIQPAYEMGKKAAELLLAQIMKENVTTPTEHIFEGRLIVRKSSEGYLFSK
ncbi:LacI family DNA-binding transcriptional regulator [Bacillus taeanensis]|uniref:LacI family transcriptional regulator n=1 Tax=Bacillus taeanensis TaxID=273032 RepID=A0A366XWE7_9BACI|nr:substrate-binding domain-containing protein [Bacillus taeanensis]RBW68464.1 LacI family transcriptional regulator [Bacillus taeanensis]